MLLAVIMVKCATWARCNKDPFGSMNILVDICPVRMSTFLCFMAPTLDVAALSAMIDGMVPLSTWIFMLALEILLISSFYVVCSLTWQSARVLLVI